MKRMHVHAVVDDPWVNFAISTRGAAHGLVS